MRAPLLLTAALAGALALAPAATPTAQAAAWTSCGGAWAGVDFAPGSITRTTTTLVAVWRRTPTTQVVTTLERRTGYSCSFTTSRVRTVPVATPPRSTGTTTVALRRYAPPNLVGSRVIGRSVQGRPITAYLVGDPTARRTALLLGQMHGDEKAGIATANAVIKGPRITGLRLWVVPTLNPDGNAAGTRTNAHGVDLNRNFAHRWARTAKGSTYGGPASFSEPESRALRDFIRSQQPARIVSVHQPLYGIDRYDLKDADLYARLVRYSGLPGKSFACRSVCRGTMSGWTNHATSSAAITVEYGRNPSAGSKTFAMRRAITFALRGSYA